MRLTPRTALRLPTRDPRGGSGRGLQGITATNSNTRISASRLAPVSSAAATPVKNASDNLGLNSERLRTAMVERLRAQGIANESVLSAMQAVARRSRAATAKPLTVTPVRAVRRVKAFFVSQKVNGRNAP